LRRWHVPRRLEHERLGRDRLDVGHPPKKCQKLMLKVPAEGRTSFEVRMLEGDPDCPYNNAEDFEACYEQIGYRTIRGPWRFEFKVHDSAGGDRPAR
jgi:hypothetical protein